MLSKEEIRQLVDKSGLITGYIDLDRQLAPNGFDLSVGRIFAFNSPGSLDFSNSQRVVPPGKEVLPRKHHREDKYGWWHLNSGAYKVRMNEAVNLPNNLAALAFSRTSLLRMGALTQNGVWDAGFKGRGECILVVENPKGINIKQNARIVQLVFLKMEPTEEYRGIYKNLK
jgi:dUTP pyrophosphatase